MSRRRRLARERDLASERHLARELRDASTSRDATSRATAAYARPVNYDDLARAIATFERTLVFLDAPFDAFVAGDHDAISAKAQEGFALFNGKARCVTCHMLSPSNPIGSDNRFHNIGVSARKQNFEELADKALKALHGKADREAQEAIDRLAIETNLSELGRFLVTKNRSDIGSFKTSQLRNVGITGPYMHDGSMQTLFDVVDHYNRGGEANPFLDDADEVQAILQRFDHVTVIHGHTHQMLSNRIGNISFHGMLSTAWPWPYAPEGLPKLTVQMSRPDPFDPNDGCGDGSAQVSADGLVDKVYNLWNRNPIEVTSGYLAPKAPNTASL